MVRRMAANSKHRSEEPRIYMTSDQRCKDTMQWEEEEEEEILSLYII